MKPLNSRHQRILKKLSVIKRRPLLGDSSTKIVSFSAKHFVRYPRHVRYFECPLLGGFTVSYYNICYYIYLRLPLTFCLFSEDIYLSLSISSSFVSQLVCGEVSVTLVILSAILFQLNHQLSLVFFDWIFLKQFQVHP